MKTLAICTLISILAVFPTGAGEPPAAGHAVSTIWTSMSQIAGTVLIRSDSSTGPEGSKEFTATCTIGYRTGGQKSEIIPVLTLPPLKNDNYAIELVAGELRVTSKNSGNMIVTLLLRNLVPALLAE